MWFSPGRDQRQLLGRLAGREPQRQPAVRDLPGQFDVARTDGGQVDGQVAAHPAYRQLQWLARAIRERERVVLTGVHHLLTPQRHPDDLDVLPGAAQRCGEPDSVPALRHLRPGHAEPEPEPPAGDDVQGGRSHRRHRRRPGRNLQYGAAHVDPAGVRGDPGQHRNRVRAVGFRRPDHREAEALRLLGQGQAVALGAGTKPPVRQVQAEPHARVPSFDRRLPDLARPSDRTPATGRQRPDASDRTPATGRHCGPNRRCGMVGRPSGRGYGVRVHARARRHARHPAANGAVAGPGGRPVTDLDVRHPDVHKVVLGCRYALGERLGCGGAADVYRGLDQVLGRPVAIKVVRHDAYDDDRHSGEMRTLAGLSHPGLVTLYDAGQDQGRGYFVMELVEGASLADRLSSGPLTERETAAIGGTVADALAYVHRRGIVHRDVKPGNVLLDRAGRAKLADFGIARMVDSARVTATGLTLGTAAYLAPEQVVGAAVRPPADVYSLGLVLLECLTGRREYDGRSVEAALARLHRPPVPPAVLPADWRRLLTAMTAREPADRPTAAAASRPAA